MSQESESTKTPEESLSDETELPDVAPDEFVLLFDDDIEEIADNDDIQPDSNTRHSEGWVKQYIECHNCHVPMVRSMLEGTNHRVDDDGRIIEQDPDVQVSNSTHRLICPECKFVSGVVEISIKKGPFGKVDDPEFPFVEE